MMEKNINMKTLFTVMLFLEMTMEDSVNTSLAKTALRNTSFFTQGIEVISRVKGKENILVFFNNSIICIT